MPASHVLLFQGDSIICSNSDQHMEDYLKFDFVGAPIGPGHSQRVKTPCYPQESPVSVSNPLSVIIPSINEMSLKLIAREPTFWLA